VGQRWNRQVAAHRHGSDWKIATTADGLETFRGIPFPVNIRMPTTSIRPRSTSQPG